LPSESKRPLSGKRILVTRPVDQARNLGTLIRQAGGEPVVFPAIEITDPADTRRLDALIENLHEYDLAIFISPTAVARAFQRIPVWPHSLQAAAVGQGSARALNNAGVKQVIAPTDGSDSEALLALPEMQRVSGKRILIFRGEGGRELLADTLRQRGATVEYAECYRRAKPRSDAAALMRQHAAHRFDGVVVTSREGLANFHALLGGGWERFQSVPFFVPHARIAEESGRLGIQQAIVTSEGDEGCVQAMSRFFMVKSPTS
jgi:uroporphyrinogen-III synthase